MSQIESEFIPYTMNPIDQVRRAMGYNYEPIPIPGMKTVPGKHVRLAKVMYRIGYWFTEKAEDWDDHTFFVMPERKPTDWKPTGAFTINYKQPEYIRYEERGKPK